MKHHPMSTTELVLWTLLLMYMLFWACLIFKTYLERKYPSLAKHRREPSRDASRDRSLPGKARVKARRRRW